jgi:hypothetical protein
MKLTGCALTLVLLLAVSCTTTGERAASQPECPPDVCGDLHRRAMETSDMFAHATVTSGQPPKNALLLTPLADGKYWVVRREFEW